MVDLPSGKMKSREGTVVDADDLIQEMADTAEEISKELGKLDEYNEEEKKALYKTIGFNENTGAGAQCFFCFLNSFVVQMFPLSKQ